MEIKIGPRMKLRRGNRHLEELINETRPLNNEYFDLSIRDRGHSCILEYIPKINMPEEFSGIIGDALSNYRSALDQIASNIIRNNTQGARAYFPITLNRKDLTGHKDLKSLEIALPGSEDLILNELRPDNNPEDWIWKFFKLNNDDKHNDPVPNILVSSIENINIRSPFFQMTDCSVTGRADQRIVIVEAPGPMTFSGDPRIMLDMTFGAVHQDAQEFSGKNVIKSLRSIRDLVEKTVTSFEDLIRRLHP